MSKQRVAVIGGGGIGGYLAYQLGSAGHDVTLCVRTAIERLAVEEGGRTHDVSVRIATRPDEVGPVSWLLLTTKAQDTAGAAPWLSALTGPDTSVAVVQNGVNQADRIAGLADGARVIPAVIYCAVERTSPTHILHHGAAQLIVPRGRASADFAALFDGTGFTVEQDDDYVTSSWRKLLSNAVFNPITALTLRRGAVFRDEGIRDLGRALLEEALMVARAEGAQLTDRDVDEVTSGFGRGGGKGGSSMLYDRLAGRPLEHEYITGAVVAAADRHGIAVPCNRTILALLSGASGHSLDGSA